MPIISNDYIGSIMMASFNFPPQGYALCNGQTLSISQNAALFSLLGINFGGNGTSTFQLPNLQGRVAMHMGNGYILGQTGGQESVTLTAAQIPTHTHTVSNVTITAPTGTSAGQASPVGGFFAPNPADTDRFGPGADEHMENASLGSMTSGDTYSTDNTGNGTAFDKRMPYLTINFCIALTGIFPSRS